MTSDHEALLNVAAKWERLYGELFVKAQRLTIERDELRDALGEEGDYAATAKELAVDLVLARREIERLRTALLSLYDATAGLEGWEGCENVSFDDEPWEPCRECRGCATTETLAARAAAGVVLGGGNEKWDWCDTCQMRVRANHAHDDTCGFCSGGPVVNDDCPIHGSSGGGNE